MVQLNPRNEIVGGLIINNPSLSFLLEQYQSDFEMQFERLKFVEEKAISILGVSSTIPAILVGLFMFGQSFSIQTEINLSILILYLYFASILCFVFAAFVSIYDLYRI